MKACWRWNNKWSNWNTWTSATMIILNSVNNNENIYTIVDHIKISREINELLQ